VDNIKMDLTDIGWTGVDWIDRAAVEGSCEYGIEPSGSIKCCTINGSSRRAQLCE
jgi:hypothetical protein